MIIVKITNIYSNDDKEHVGIQLPILLTGINFNTSIQHGYVISPSIKCGMKLPIHGWISNFIPYFTDCVITHKGPRYVMDGPVGFISSAIFDQKIITPPMLQLPISARFDREPINNGLVFK